MNGVYYNEFEPKKAAALAALIEDGHIEGGFVDGRGIEEVRAADLTGFRQCNFFAGIGLWNYALRLAGWPPGRSVWTGSCPCQPFSSAGLQKGKDDERHLWPEWLRLIRECRPPAIFGEQVASAIAHGWLDDVYKGLEAEGYAVGAVILPACGVGAPHRRERLWFVADLPGEQVGAAGQPREYGHVADSESKRRGEAGASLAGPEERPSGDGPLGHAASSGLQNGGGAQGGRSRPKPKFKRSGRSLGDSVKAGLQGQPGHCRQKQNRRKSRRLAPIEDGPAWEASFALTCGDGKQRLVKPGVQLLANGYPERVGLLHCAGDALVPQVGAAFIKSYMEARGVV